MRWMMKSGSFSLATPLFLLFLLPLIAAYAHAESIQIPLDGFVQVLPGYYQYSGQNIPAPISLNISDTPSGYAIGPITFSPTAIHFTSHTTAQPSGSSYLGDYWHLGIQIALPSPVQPKQPPISPIQMNYSITALPASSSLICDASQAGAASLGGSSLKPDRHAGRSGIYSLIRRQRAVLYEFAGRATRIVHHPSVLA